MNINTKHTLISFAMISLLTACGGSSKGSDNTNANSGGGAGKGTVLPKFTTVTSVTSSCSDIVSTQSDVVFHNANGKVVSTTKSDNSGKIDANIPQGTQHISVIMSSTDKNGNKSTFVDTYLDVANGLALDNLSFYDYDDTCTCKYEAQVNISELIDASPFYTLEGINSRPIELYIAGDTVQMCSQYQHAYLSIKDNSLGDVRAAKVDLSSGQVYLKDADFTHQGVKVDYSHIDEQLMGTVNIRGAIDNRDVFHQVSRRTPDNLYIFPTLATTNHASLADFERINLDQGSLEALSVAYKTIDENGNFAQPTHLSAFDVGYEFSNSFVNAFMSQNGNTMSYDYTNAVPSADRVEYMMAFNDFKHGSVEWYINSEAKATIPDLEFGSILTDDTMDESSMHVSFRIYDYNHEGSYIDFMNTFKRQSYEQRIASGLYDGGARLTIDFNVN